MRIFVFTLFFLLSFEAFANNMFIPNYYRNRRQPNAYASIGWSDRKEAGLWIEQDKDETERAGVKTSESSELAFQPYLFYKMPQGLNVEAMFRFGNGEDEVKTGTAHTDDEDSRVNHLALGYEAPAAPIAFGFSYTAAEFEETDGLTGAKSDDELRSINLGIGYRLPSNLYIGAGYTNSRWDFGGTDDSYDSFAFGVGQVFGDEANPDGALELDLLYVPDVNDNKIYDLTLRGLINQENIQYYAELGWDKTDTDDNRDSSGWDAALGLDYQIMNFYAGPEFRYDVDKTDRGTSADSVDTSISLEAGVRLVNFEGFVRYDIDKGEDKFDAALALDGEREGNTIALGAAYKF